MHLTCPNCGARFPPAPGPPGTAGGVHVCPACATGFTRGTGVPAPPGSGGGCLLVAAEPGPFQSLLCGVLRKLGYSVRVTADGEQALEWVRKIRPDAVFAAVFLRRMLGITLAERLRDMAGGNPTRLALIGLPLGESGVGADVHDLYGADCYLEESLRPEALRGRVEAFLRRGAPAAAPSLDPGVEEEIRRIGRVAAEDLYLYHPAEVMHAARGNRLEETFRDDIEKGRRQVADRFPQVPRAEEIFLSSLTESLRRTAGRNPA